MDAETERKRGDVFARHAVDLEARLREAEGQRDKYREALERIAAGPPNEGETELIGEHETDVRDRYPARMRWVREQARAVLHDTETHDG